MNQSIYPTIIYLFIYPSISHLSFIHLFTHTKASLASELPFNLHEWHTSLFFSFHMFIVKLKELLQKHWFDRYYIQILGKLFALYWIQIFILWIVKVKFISISFKPVLYGLQDQLLVVLINFPAVNLSCWYYLQIYIFAFP